MAPVVVAVAVVALLAGGRPAWSQAPPQPCPPGGAAPGVLRVLFAPGTPASERATAHATAGAAPGEETVYDDGSIAVTVTVPPGTEETALRAYRARAGVRSAVQVAIPPPVCPTPPPTPPPVLPIPGSGTVPPGGVLVFSDRGPTPPPGGPVPGAGASSKWSTAPTGRRPPRSTAAS